MRHIDCWRVEDDDTVLLIQPQALDVFNRFAQIRSDMPESGGIILGYVRGLHLEVLEVTAPSFWDRQLRFFFERSSRGHREVAERRWRESAGLVRYLGEWHTHPQDYPFPSAVDRMEWGELAKKRSDKRPVLAIVVGRKALHVELIFADSTSIILRPDVQD